MGGVAFVFAGQGAQKVGMGRTLYEGSRAARSAMDQIERIRPGTLAMCFDGPAEVLNETVNTQPCLFAVDYACAVAAVEAGIAPDCAAGFSLGEVAAAAFCGMLSLDQAVKAVVRRAECMQACAQKNPGAMLAVLRLPPDRVEEIAAETGAAYPVNYNCPGQTVVACAEASVAPLTTRVQAERGRAVRLNVSGPFHSPWMREAADAFEAHLSALALSSPAVPLYANATAAPYSGDLAGLLSRQIASPVRWQQTIERMAEAGVDTFYELGPGTTLSGLIAKILPGARTASVSCMDDVVKIGGTNA